MLGTPAWTAGLDDVSCAVVRALLDARPLPPEGPPPGSDMRVLLLGAFDGVAAMTRALAKHRSAHDALDLPIVLLGPPEVEPEMMAAVSCLAANDWVTMPSGISTLQHRVRAAFRLATEMRRHAELVAHDALLRTILPEPFASSMALGAPRPPPVEHPWVAILFSDVVGFTSMCSSLTTAEVVRLLDTMYSAFDALAESLGVFKVETIGDAYMAAAWAGDGPGGDVRRVLRLAEGMLAAVRGFPRRVEIRVGVHVGPASSGVVGTARPRYCFFGDTVNFASRMESTGYASRVQVSCDAVAALRAAGLASGMALERIDDKTIKGRAGPTTTYVWTPAAGSPA